MRWMSAAVLAACFLLAAPGAAEAQKAPARTERSPLVIGLERCRQIANPTQRLACYDSASGALVQAANTGQVRVVDRAQIQQARRSLFGFSMPSLALFGGGGDDKNDPTATRLDTTIKSVEQTQTGRYRMVLAEGNAVWETTEDRVTLDPPRKGQKVSILRGPLGSFFIRINGQNGVRGRRVS